MMRMNIGFDSATMCIRFALAVGYIDGYTGKLQHKFLAVVEKTTAERVLGENTVVVPRDSSCALRRLWPPCIRRLAVSSLLDSHFIRPM